MSMKPIESPLVSVVMPCYNAANFIGDSIDSVIQQTYANWELIIVDDGSRDNSLEVIKKYAALDSRVRYIVCPKPSGGPATPRNLGIDNAKGRYIAFLDSDDIWTPDKMKTQVDLIQKGGYVVVYCNYYSMDEEGVVREKTRVEPEKCDYNKLLHYNCIGCSEAMYDKTLAPSARFKQIGHEDYLFWLHVMQNGGEAKNTNKTQLHYRERNGSVSSNKVRAAKWTWHIFREELQLPLLNSIYYFICYALKGIQRHI